MGELRPPRGGAAPAGTRGEDEVTWPMNANLLGGLLAQTRLQTSDFTHSGPEPDPDNPHRRSLTPLRLGSTLRPQRLTG